MGTILAADTTTTLCSVALLYKGQTLQRAEETPHSHTQSLLPMINEVLTEAGITVGDVDAIAFTEGPGSFTGIRIGFGVVQGLAMGAEKPVIPISTLWLLATTAIRKLQISDNRILLPALDARMGEIYWSAFQVAAGAAQRLVRDSLSNPAQAFTSFDGAAGIGVGDGWQFAEQISCKPEYSEVGMLPEAVDMLTAAATMFAAGDYQVIDAVQPAYLRETVSWKKHQRLRVK